MKLNSFSFFPGSLNRKPFAVKQETTADQLGDEENNVMMWDGDGRIIKKPFAGEYSSGQAVIDNDNKAGNF